MSANALMMQVFQIAQIVSPGYCRAADWLVWQEILLLADSANVPFSAATGKRPGNKEPVATASKPLPCSQTSGNGTIYLHPWQSCFHYRRDGARLYSLFAATVL
jgi:hypothetical protein